MNDKKELKLIEQAFTTFNLTRASATFSEVRSAYKNLMRRWHPDKNLNNLDEALAKAKEITVHYSILADFFEKPEEAITPDRLVHKDFWDNFFDMEAAGFYGTPFQEFSVNSDVIDSGENKIAKCYSYIKHALDNSLMLGKRRMEDTINVLNRNILTLNLTPEEMHSVFSYQDSKTKETILHYGGRQYDTTSIAILMRNLIKMAKSFDFDFTITNVAGDTVFDVCHEDQNENELDRWGLELLKYTQESFYTRAIDSLSPLLQIPGISTGLDEIANEYRKLSAKKITKKQFIETSKQCIQERLNSFSPLRTDKTTALYNAIAQLSSNNVSSLSILQDATKNYLPGLSSKKSTLTIEDAHSTAEQDVIKPSVTTQNRTDKARLFNITSDKNPNLQPVFNSTTQKKPTANYAFLDVDQTLLYNNNDINEAFLDELKAQGITDVYLFTNMSMKEISYYGHESRAMTRYELIKYLESSGFSVHGVITPADTGFYKSELEEELYPSGYAYEELYKPLYERVIADDKSPVDATSNVDNFVDFLWNRYLWDKASYFSAQKRDIRQGETKEVEVPELIVLDENRNRYVCTNRDELKATILKLRSTNTRFDIIQDTPNKLKMNITGSYDDNKASMMALAIQELTAQHQGDVAIFFADDTSTHLNGAEQAVADFNQDPQNMHKVFLTTCLMPTSFEKSKGPEAKANYRDSMKKFNIKDIFDKLIDAEITRLLPDKEEGFFTYSSNNKIKALEELKIRLQSASHDTTYGHIIEEWESEIKYKNGVGQLVKRSTMINSHRNFFSTLCSFSDTKTAEFIESLKSNYGVLIANPLNPKHPGQGSEIVLCISS